MLSLIARLLPWLLPLSLAACGGVADDALQGYAEGEYVRIGAPFAGRLEALLVERGAQIKKGAPLFRLEQVNESAADREAEARALAAAARLANMRSGRRAPEIAAVEAQLAQARAAGALSSAQLQRQQRLFEQGFLGQEMLDQARAVASRDAARVREWEAQLLTARLPAREEEIRAAAKDMVASRAAQEQAAWRLGQKTQTAPLAGVVQDTLFVEGEWVPAGAAVLSLLPPENIKLRFFVPESRLGALRLGQAVTAHCDGCGAPISARINYIAPQAEYTPPVIYSKESRAKLVFMVEARPSPQDGARLHPGQPLDIRLP